MDKDEAEEGEKERVRRATWERMERTRRGRIRAVDEDEKKRDKMRRVTWEKTKRMRERMRTMDKEE